MMALPRPRFMLGPAEMRLVAVGAYSFAAFSVAALVQILSAGTAKPEMHPHLARVAFAAAPLLAAGLALDYYCVGRPRMRHVGAILCVVVGMLTGMAVSAFATVIGAYSPASGSWIGVALWVALGLLATVFVAASVFDPRGADDADAPPAAVDARPADARPDARLDARPDAR